MSVSDILNQTLSRVTRDNSTESLDLFQTPQSDRPHESYQSALKKNLDARPKRETPSSKAEVPEEFRSRTSQTQDSKAASSDEPSDKVEQGPAEKQTSASKKPAENSGESPTAVASSQEQQTENQNDSQEDSTAPILISNPNQEADNNQTDSLLLLDETGEELPVVPASLSQQLNSQANSQESTLTNEFKQADPAESEQSLPTPASLLEIQKLLNQETSDAESADSTGQSEINSEIFGNEELLTETLPSEEANQDEISQAEKLAAVEKAAQKNNVLLEKPSENQTNDTEESSANQNNSPETETVLQESAPESETPQNADQNDNSSESNNAESGLAAKQQEPIVVVENKTQSTENDEHSSTDSSTNEPVIQNASESKSEQKNSEVKQNESQQNSIKSPVAETSTSKPNPQGDLETLSSVTETDQDSIVVDTQSSSTPKETKPVSSGVRSGILPAADSHEFMERLTELVQAADSGEQKLQVRLTPPQLGSLNIEVTKVDGVVTAKLEVQSSAAQQVLLEHLTGLKESLSQQGNVVERIEIQVQDPNRSEQGQNQSQNEQQRQQQDQSFTEENSDQEEPSEENGNEGRKPEEPQSTLIDNLDIQI